MKITLLSILLAASALCAGCVRLPADVSNRLASAKQKFGTITSEMSRAEVLERLGPPAAQEGNTFVWRESGPGLNYEKLTVTFTADGRTRSLGTSGARFIRVVPGVTASRSSSTEVQPNEKN